MVKKAFVIIMLPVWLQAGEATAQQENDPFRDHAGYLDILRFQGTFSAGYNTAFASLNYFLHGDLEYYFDQKLSVRSDIYYFLNSRTPSDAVEPFGYQHSLFTGVQYHLLQGRFDWYVGLQPGFVWGQRQYEEIDALDGTVHPLPAPQKTVAALFSVNTGINYYASRLFHLFVHVRYNAGWFSDNYSVASLSECRASFGLGFFIRTRKTAVGDHNR